MLLSPTRAVSALNAARASSRPFPPAAEDRTAAARRYPDEPLAFLADRDLFGDLIDDERFTGAYGAHLDALHTHGARATVEELEARLPH